MCKKKSMQSLSSNAFIGDGRVMSCPKKSMHTWDNANSDNLQKQIVNEE